MAFDQSTRNRLQKFVAECRAILTEEFTRQLQATYGLDPKSGVVAKIESLTFLDNQGRQTANLLRETLAHYEASIKGKSCKERTKEAINRIIREQAFTVLNRLAALRMAEARGFLIESISKGYDSKGFQLYKNLAGTGLGETGEAYRCYLFSLFDEFSLDLAVLFDRNNVQGRLFPREAALLELLGQINHFEIEHLWAEDETIGWIYQFWNGRDEIDKMRAASRSPRNSREMAVRNQFFTPRYVVEFLTDNTLGRIWYEMTQGKTALVENCRYLVRRPHEIFLSKGESAPDSESEDQENLSQEELLKQPVYIPYRVLKDPREILMLDPACGSMHFGLYAFDLYEKIYEEAWNLESELGPDVFKRTAELRPLHDTYASFEEFKQAVPKLIVEHNIHGVDIDPRAVQISGLSLWQRAHRAWHEMGIKPNHRPTIKKSNIVCAEPMPGEKEMLLDFTSKLTPPVLGQLVKTIFDKMELAGEAGTLLKIEEEIQASISNAKKEFDKEILRRKEQAGYLPGMAPKRQPTILDFAALPDETKFWDTAEERILNALNEYAEHVVSNEGQKRLFVEDAAKGFAFIDLCRKRYDVVLMNPPFGEASEKLASLAESNYPVWNRNLLCAFINRASEYRETNGKIGVIFDRTAVIKSTYEGFREKILLRQSIESILDLGWNVLDANVEVISLTLSGTDYSKDHHTHCIDVRQVEPDFKATVAAETLASRSPSLIVRDQRSFAALPNQVIGYDFPEILLEIFLRFPALKDSGAKANPGLQVKMDRYGRLRCEVNASDFANERYINMYNGSPFCRFYTPSVDCVLWEKTGEMLKNHPSTRWNNSSRYKIAGVGYGKRGDTLDAHVLPSNSVFTIEGLAVFPSKRENFYYYLGILNAPLVSWIINYFCGQHKHAGYVDLIPVPPPCDDMASSDLDRFVKIVVAQKKEFNACHEVTALFITPWYTVTSLPEHGIIAWISDTLSLQASMASKYVSELETCVENAYHLSTVERTWLRPYLEPHFQDSASPYEGELSLQDDLAPCAANLLSYMLGTTFGRWDIRYATGGKELPELPDPFDPLPICPPGMLQSKDGLPAEQEDVPADYPLRISWHGILVDDDGHPEHIVVRIRETIKAIWQDRAEAIEQEACEILSVRTLCDYFRRPSAFFADHLKRYSKSRRQAPIYWPLQTPSGSYTLWVYYHRLTDQTLYTCVMDFVEPKLKTVGEDLTVLRNKSIRSSAQEKELANITDLEAELKEFRDELLHIAKFWKPNLNDGVQITAAPLWKLFQHKPWQKKLKETWEKLEKGDYDWAHLAYSIWPERVLRKCHKDHSLAIAHGVEDDLWEEVVISTKKGGNNTKWQPQKLSGSQLDELIQRKIVEARQ
jgi:hypothetical protein